MFHAVPQPLRWFRMQCLQELALAVHRVRSSVNQHDGINLPTYSRSRDVLPDVDGFGA